jgi:ankyrin repeat protein
VPALIVLLSLTVAVLNTVSHEDPFRQGVDQNAVAAAVGPVGPRSGADVFPLPNPASESTTTIHEAARDGDLDRVDGALALDPSLLDATDDDGMTPLAVAAWYGHLELARNLLDQGANPDIRNRNGLTPLFCAVDRSRGELSRLLIRGGADLKTRGYRGRTLLHMAARSGAAGVARTLIHRGADVNATDVRGVTSLDLAVWHGHGDMVELLVDNGALRSGAPPPSYLGKKRPKGVSPTA